MLLAIDTSAHLCSVALYDSKSDTIVSRRVDDIGRGHAELLMDQIENCLDQASLNYSNIRRIGVVTGPGSFTGVRVGLAAARGLRVSLNVETVGITSLQACEQAALDTGFNGSLLTILDARRGQAYCQLSGREKPFLSAFEELSDKFQDEPDGVCGSGCRTFLEMTGKNISIIHELSAPPIENVARIAGGLTPNGQPPEPVYLRSADAKPQTGFGVEIA